MSVLAKASSPALSASWRRCCRAAFACNAACLARRPHVDWGRVAGALAVIFSLSAATKLSADETPFVEGRKLFAEHCASCHGEEAQGSPDAYAEPLAGELTSDALARLIERTMPEGEPELVEGDAARHVANFLYHEFYSWDARLRKGLAEVPRVELARLTVPQYQNSVADLLGHFTPDPSSSNGRRGRRGRSNGQDAAPPEPGWQADYYGSKGMSKADRLSHQKIDKQIVFDFGETSPKEGIPDDQFAIIWQGSLAPYDTGYYQFRVKTENGVRLYLNADQVGQRRRLRDDSSAKGQSALIDGWVSSGKMREHTARVFLLGGRQYPIRVEFFKYKDPSASIIVEWKAPHGTWEPLNHLHVNTGRSPRVFVLPTAFPADDRSLGYERGSSVTRDWHLATNAAAIATADELIDRLPILLTSSTVREGVRQAREAASAEDTVNESTPTEPSATEPSATEVQTQPQGGTEVVDTSEALADADAATDVRLDREAEAVLMQQFAELAFRRPLEPAELAVLDTLMFDTSIDREQAVRRTVLFVMKSPSFLYSDLTPVDSRPTPFTVAARLSFALWDSIPDRELLDAAHRGELGTREQLEAQANRMLDDRRARAKMRSFFHHWLELEERDFSKDQELFPGFDEAVVSDLRLSLELFIDSVVWSDRSDYRELLLADYLPLNTRLAKLYAPETEREAEGEAAATRAATESVEQPDETLTSESPTSESLPEEATPTESEAAGSSEASADATPQQDGSDSEGSNGQDGSDEAMIDVTVSDEFHPIRFPAERRSGVLTHPYLLSALAYHNNTSPIHRGVFVTRNVVGRTLKSPPIAVAFKDDEFAPDLTMREKITQLTQDAACVSCHSVINPLGFALENYDAIGRYRLQDNHKPIDSVSLYMAEDGTTVQVKNARDIAQYAVGTPAASQAFVRQLFRYVTKQTPLAYGLDTTERLSQDFVADEYNIQDLIVRIAVTFAQQGLDPGPSGD